MLAQTSNYFSNVDIDYVGRQAREAKIIQDLEAQALKNKAVVKERFAYLNTNDEVDETLEAEQKQVSDILFEKPFSFYSFHASLNLEKKEDIMKNYIIDTLVNKNANLQRILDRYEESTSRVMFLSLYRNVQTIHN